MKYSFAVRKFSKLFLITLLFTLLGTNLFGQKKSAPGTVASISDKNKATVEARPALLPKQRRKLKKPTIPQFHLHQPHFMQNSNAKSLTCSIKSAPKIIFRHLFGAMIWQKSPVNIRKIWRP